MDAPRREPTATEWAYAQALRSELKALNEASTASNPSLGLSALQIHVVVNTALVAIMTTNDKRA